MSYRLKIDITSYWHPGSGKGMGSYLDAATHRNSDGLPVLPGRTLKGIVRDAFTRWETYQGHDIEKQSSTVQQLFGSTADGEETRQGLLRFSNAGLPQEEAAYLAHHPDLCEGLYRSHFSTAIDHATGTADEKSLRGIEMVIPLTLYATVDTIPSTHNKDHKDHKDDWQTLIQPALSLIHAVGAYRSRGFGRATLTLVEE